MSDVTVAGLAESLLNIGNEHRTGVLRMSADGHLRMAFFEGGALVYLLSDVAEENLAACFARAGRFERAHERLELFQLEKEVTRKKSLVALVLERGFRDADTVRSWLVEYAYEVFARVFDSRDVASKFTAGVQAEHPLAYRVPVSELILEAVRGMRDEEAIHEAVGPTSLYTRPAGDAAELMQTLPLSFYEGLVAASVTGPISLADLVVVAGIPEADALRALLALRLVEAVAPFYEAKGLSDSGRIRMREAALETGFAIDSETAAAALGLSASASREDARGDGALTMGELEGATPFVAPTRPRGSSAPLVYQQPRVRGDTGRLRLLASAYIQMGESEAAAGNFAAAVQCFESALAQKPNDLDVMLAYARVHARRPGGVSAAEKLLDQACEAHPKSATPFVALARIYLEAGRVEEAEDALLEARRLEPGNSEVRTMLEGFGRKGGAGGLLSRLRLRSDAKIKPNPPRPAASRPAPHRPVVPPSPSANGEGPRLVCRYCGRTVQAEARICRCGATL